MVKYNLNKVKNLKKELIQLYIFILIIITSGHIYGSFIYYKEGIILLFLSSLLINRMKPISKKNLIIFLLTSSVILLNYFTWMSNVDGYIGLIIKIFSVILLVNNINFQKFKKYFVLFFFIYSIISLFCYFTMLSDWHLIESITTPKEVWGDTMRSTIIYNFPYKPFYRNFGFYHEGGMYAIFLNIALLFSYRIEKLKNINIIRIILIITIATTLSTTGMIGAVLIIVLSIRNNKNLIKSIITFIVLIVIIIYIEGKLGIISNKFNIDNESFNARSSEVNVVLNIMEDNFLTGIGYQNNLEISRYTDMTMTNGILSLFSEFGLISGLTLFLIYIIGIYKNFELKIDKVLIIILFILFSASEPVIFSPLFLLLIFTKSSILETKGE